MRILTICPSIRPDKLRIMLDSYINTSNCAAIIINDEIKPITQIFNEIFQKNPDFDYYHLSNDDVIYKTQDWDIILANKIINGGISYGNDMIQGENLPSFPMISGNIVRALGWLQMPTLNRYAGDVVWKYIGQATSSLHYVPDVYIEHNWEGVDKEINIEDMKRFAEWLPISIRDINKVKESLCQK